MMKIKSQTLKNLNEMMMVVVVPQMQNTSKIKSNKKFRIVAVEDDDDEFTIRRILPVWDRNIGDEVSRYDYIYDIDELP